MRAAQLGAVTLTAKTTLNDSEIAAVSFDASDAATPSARNYDDDFLPLTPSPVPNGSESDEIGSLRFSGAGGKFGRRHLQQEDDLGSMTVSSTASRSATKSTRGQALRCNTRARA